ncbi:MAG: hypothetical protein RJQ09_08900 [Cyclobacteriaceae bacterium]
MKLNKDIDRKFRLARIWSNGELRKFAHLFNGDIANVSGWKDTDKEGSYYRDYFSNAKSYTITNYKSEARGFQGMEGEIFLDLTEVLPDDLKGKFNVVFNHTVLEHIYEVHLAFRNLCSMSKDIVIIVVPFLQQMHADYGDYWRFTPLTIRRMFSENDFEILYLSFNSEPNASVYIFCIATRNPHLWKSIERKFDYVDPINANDGFENYIGCHAIENVISSKRFNWGLTYTKWKRLISLISK